MHTYVIALDQGTTSSRAVLFDENARIVAMKAMNLSRFIAARLGGARPGGDPQYAG
ncbi:MAG: hypothetical protein ACLUMK_06095 [Christensenellales bacterium]